MRQVQRLLAVSFLSTLLAVCVLGWQVVKTRDQQRSIARLVAEGKQAHDNLCRFKAGLAGRIKEGQDFLDAHPKGIPGISRADIERSLAGQRATLNSFSQLICNPKGAPHE